MVEALFEKREFKGNRIWVWQLEKAGIDPNLPWTLEDTEEGFYVIRQSKPQS